MKDSARRAMWARLRMGVSQYGIPFGDVEIGVKTDTEKKFRKSKYCK